MNFLDLTLPTIEENLAFDEAILSEVEADRLAPLLRVWEFPRGAIVLGASGRLHEDVDVERCLADGVPVGRRSSGGGTVVLGPGALNFTVILASDTAKGLQAVDFAQHFVLEKVAAELIRIGVPVEVRGSGDLVFDGKKCSGSAQRRLKRFFLVHASILFDFDLSRIPRYTRVPKRQPSYREGRSHEEFVTNLPVTRETMIACLRHAWDAHGLVTCTPTIRMTELVAEKFGQPSWTHRM